MPKKKAIKSFNTNIGAKLNKIKVFVLIAIILIILIFLALSYMPIFNIKHIEVFDNSVLSNEQVVEQSKIELEKNIFKLNKLSVINNLLSNSYIESAKIKRKLPATIELHIIERKPAFMIQLAESYILLNDQGYMLEVSSNKPELPIIVGFTTDVSNAKAGDRLISEDTEKLNRILYIINSAKSKQLYDKISKIDVSNLSNCSIEFQSEGKTAYIGNCTELDIRLDYVKTIMEQEAGHTGLVFVNMDLSTGKAFFREE